MKFSFYIFFVASALVSCKQTPTGPTPPSGPDTTSHNFLWTLDTLGDGNSSTLYDVAIINDTLAYAVGEISVLDSIGGYRAPAYNIARWNGKKWDLTVLNYQFSYTPCYSIVAFGPNDIWVGSSAPRHWDGSRWKFYGFNGDYTGGFYVTAIGGSSSNNLYCGGAFGKLEYFNGTTWKPVQSGTSAPIQDMWGGSSSLVGGDVVLMAAAEKFQMGDKKILRAKPGGVIDTLGWHAEDYRPIHSVWFDNNSSIFVCGTGVFSNDGSGWSEISQVPFYFTNRIRGNSASDIIVVGDFGMVAHYNGSTWRTYPEVMLPAGQYNSVAIKGNTVIAVGIIAGSSKAAALIGRR